MRKKVERLKEKKKIYNWNKYSVFTLFTNSILLASGRKSELGGESLLQRWTKR